MHLLQRTGTRSRLLSCSASALLALGALALIGCGDNMDQPADAAAPDAPPAPPAPDARPLDAGQLDGGGTDGGGTDGGGGIDATPSDATPADAFVSTMCGTLVDEREPNDTAGTAPTVETRATSANPEWIYGEWLFTACVAGTNEDWYRLAVSQIRFDLADDSYDGRPTMRLRFRADGAGLCSHIPACEDPSLPSGPENTVTVEVYHAATMTLITQGTSTSGYVRIDGSNTLFEDDLLIRAVGPAEALYRYRVYVFIDSTGSEDECEC